MYLTGRTTRTQRSEYNRPETIEETAEVLGVSPATVKREWNFAKAWLHRALTGEANA